MPEAHIENGISAQAVIGSSSGLARDVFVNTFHFNKIPGGRPTDGDLDNLGGMIRDFYIAAIGAHGTPDSWMSRAVDRGANKCVVKLYRLDDAPPRQPHLFPFTLNPWGGGTDTGLPREMAVCLSYKCVTQPGPRGRGRIYIGPLKAQAVEYASPGDYRPSGTLMLGLIESGVALRDASGAANLPWQVYSRMNTAQHMHTVTNLWVDNEFDVVRGRGLRPTSRVT
jgi:hypothetical protein